MTLTFIKTFKNIYLSYFKLKIFSANRFKNVLFLLIFSFLSSCSQKIVGPTLNTVIPEYLHSNEFEAQNGFILKDNDQAFASKIDIIQKAEKELRLIYYIFDLDESTAYMTNEILKKIEKDKDFSVKLLTDYQWNYKNLDFFRWLEKQQPHGIQQIEIRFYNRPSISVIKFAEFMTLGCANAKQNVENNGLDCTEEKLNYLNKYNQLSLAQAEEMMSVEAKIFLAGFYAKDPNGILFGTQLGYGRDLQTMTESPNGTPTIDEAQKQTLLKVMKLYWSAKTGSTAEKIQAKIQLSIAGLFFGKELKPFLNGVETILPFSLKNLDGSALMTHPEIAYITDYTHHKFILADTKNVQVGGRNCANAYHMHPNELEKKYIFMDTDVYLNLDQNGGALFKNTFEDLWGFSEMVATTSEIESHAPIGFLYLLNQANTLAETECSEITDPLQKAGCTGQVFSSLLDTGYSELVHSTQNEWGEKFHDYLSKYEKEYLAKIINDKHWTQLSELFDSENGFTQNTTFKNSLHSANVIPLKTQEMYYVENVPYSLSPSEVNQPKQRHFGSLYGEEIEHGKMIHKVWEDAFIAACAKSEKTNEPVEVIIHQGYFAPTESVVHQMNKLMNEKICPNVKLKIYTNSIVTTDLTPINFIGRRQLHALFQENKNFDTPKFEYFEYNKSVLDSIVVNNFPLENGVKGTGSFSLHSKVILFDDDIYIGSSNAEFRSYMMDTNNGVFLKDVPEIVASYKKTLKNLEDNNIVIDAKSSLQFRDLTQLRQQEEKDVAELRQRYAMDDRSFLKSRKAQLEYTITQLYEILDQVSVEMEQSLKRKKLKGKSKLDELLKVF
ncbi:hypothetical protein [Ulvibacter litoralis]|uniref:PLD phosphodiesterase domain-containing protein n=1 Tax=Ulvibacter litoralis TaxID=227084 RepID=A0A1G7FRT3_9FLAO|nr:hypothetical protein [Ulvibacter litoralis]GHC63747.1 hypothetical protein GCM10008083_31330 [Ulvibacter litoralis]SDE78611.1 hypothetical protein SAMN05421855_102736 [Ulvibacter litoralis]